MRNTLFAFVILLITTYFLQGSRLSSMLFKKNSEVLVEYQHALSIINKANKDVKQPASAFSDINNVNAKKAAFFDFLTPGIYKANQKIIALRTAISSLNTKHLDPGIELLSSEKTFLAKIANRYEVDVFLLDEENFDGYEFSEMLSRVDTIPPSLTLAQSANESAWGTSRFAREANNYFGQWCFTEGCGIVPKRRDPDAEHEVKTFKSVQASIEQYMLNLNRNQSYAQLRQIRSSSRKDQSHLNGLNLATGLINYSERGTAYIKEVKAIIKGNKLELLDLHPTGEAGYIAK